MLAELDARQHLALLSGATVAVAARPDRVDIDLRGVDSWTQESAGSLVGCREVCSELPGGRHYRTGRGGERDALLAAFG